MANPVERRAISPEMQELREAVLELTHNQRSQAKMFEDHEALLKTLVEDRLENTRYKARVGGIVLGTGFAVSAVWSLVIFAADFFRGH